MDISRCWNNTQEQEVRAVAEDGCAVVKVLADTNLSAPEWAYTVGLWHSYQHPEVLIVGLPHEMTQILLHNINYRIRHEGVSFRDGSVTNDVIDGFDCFFQTIERENYDEWFAANQWFYGDDHFTAVQMLWPDVRGVYPWQNEADSYLRWNQPLLSAPPKRFRN